MSSTIVKILFGLAIVILLSIGGGLIWYTLFYQPAPAPVNTATSSPEDLFPVGEEVGVTTATSTASSTLGVAVTGGGVRAQELLSNPIAGFGVFGGSATNTVVIAVDRSNGHVYRISTASSTVEKIANTTMVGVQEAYVGETKSLYYIISRYEANSGPQTHIQSIKKSLTAITASSTANSGSLLPQIITSIALSPKRDRYATVVKGSTGGSVVYITDFATGKKREVYRSPLAEWNLLWPNESTLTLETKGSSRVRGTILSINTQTGAATRILGNIAGLTSLPSPSLSYVLSSESREDGGINLFRYTPKSGDRTPLSFDTFPYWCVWAQKTEGLLYCAAPDTIPSVSFPDAWYRGELSFNTKIWKFNVKTGDSEIVWNPNLTGTLRTEARNLALNSSGTLLFYINDNSLTLWSVRLTDL